MQCTWSWIFKKLTSCMMMKGAKIWVGDVMIGFILCDVLYFIRFVPLASRSFKLVTWVGVQVIYYISIKWACNRKSNKPRLRESKKSSPISGWCETTNWNLKQHIRLENSKYVYFNCYYILLYGFSVVQHTHCKNGVLIAQLYLKLANKAMKWILK